MGPRQDIGELSSSSQRSLWSREGRVVRDEEAILAFAEPNPDFWHNDRHEETKTTTIK